jgi:parallel beta-helix repeat protein
MVAVANATIVYVDNSKPCPGTGSTTSPYCSLTFATSANSKLQCGDIIKVRTGSRSYRETIMIDKPSCPDSAPIVVQADNGHLPILTSLAGPQVKALFHLLNVSNWRVEGLIFDGKRAGGNGTTTPQRALMAQARDIDVTGIVFRQNQVRNWALYKEKSLDRGSAIVFEGNQRDKKFVLNSLITENIVENVRGTGLHITHARNSTISKNDISKLLCKMETNSQGDINAMVIGIKEKNITTTADDPSSDTMDNTFEENVIHDLPDAVTCAIESGIVDPPIAGSVFGYWCDVGAKSGKVLRNKIYNIGYVTEAAYNSRGILIESRCHEYTVEGNEISKIGGPGIEIRNANQATIRHNTVYDTRSHGVHLKDGAQAVIKDNIFSKIRASGVHIQDLARQDGGHTIDYNLYDHVGQPGSISGVTVPKTFVGWQQSCQCEANGRTGDIFTDPENRDFTLRPWSPAVSASSTGTDMGAFE